MQTNLVNQCENMNYTNQIGTMNIGSVLNKDDTAVFWVFLICHHITKDAPI